MYLNILFLPLIGSFIGGFFGRILGSKGSSFLTTALLCASCFLSLLAFYEVALNGGKCVFVLIPWINADLFNLSWAFLFDTLTVTILVVITFISFLVHMYSYEYIKIDPHLPRFISYLSLFTFFILILVSANNFLQIFVGWEGVGLCSYLLINFWFTRIQANKAAIKAMLVNRVGDFGLALGIFTIYTSFDSIDYSVVFALAPALKGQCFYFCGFYIDTLNFICILLFVGAVGKSAQLGLHSWLPDAIEGPTPVSALIHAATIVTAGVFLLGRCSPLFEYAEQSLMVVTFFGAITTFFAATTGLLQNDLKRVIAYSTCSQLGYIIFACGLSHYSLGIFHLANHAFFKALLFLGAGSVIHGLSDEQDLRKIGGLRRLLPFTYAIITIGSFSLIGLPFLTGFYSKDAILEVAYAKYSNFGHFAYVLGSISAFLTAFYSYRLIYLCFLSSPNGYRPLITNAHESSFLISFPLGVLAIPSIFLGYIIKDVFIGFGTPFWANALFTHISQIVDAEFLEPIFKLLPVFLSVFGAWCSYYLYTYNSKDLFEKKVSKFGLKLYIFLNRKWFFDKIYNDFISQTLLDLSYITTYKHVDRGILESTGPKGLNALLRQVSNSFAKLNSGSFYHLSLSMLIGLILIICGFFFGNYPSFYILALMLAFTSHSLKD
jgi:proton-translocating NADH-quinone oxidoreductase chain L